MNNMDSISVAPSRKTRRAMKKKMDSTEVQCGICKVHLVTHWYTCLRCPNFKVCATCNDLNLSSSPHGCHHPVQSVLTKEGETLYYEEATHISSERSFACPLCFSSADEYKVDTLLDHLRDAHTLHTLFAHLKCPVCISRFYSQNIQKVTYNNLNDHIMKFHTPDPYPEATNDAQIDSKLSASSEGPEGIEM